MGRTIPLHGPGLFPGAEVVAGLYTGHVAPAGAGSATPRAGLWRSWFGRGAKPEPQDPEIDRLRTAVELANQKIYDAGRAGPDADADRSMGTNCLLLPVRTSRRAVFRKVRVLRSARPGRALLRSSEADCISLCDRIAMRNLS